MIAAHRALATANDELLAARTLYQPCSPELFRELADISGEIRKLQARNEAARHEYINKE